MSADKLIEGRKYIHDYHECDGSRVFTFNEMRGSNAVMVSQQGTTVFLTPHYLRPFTPAPPPKMPGRWLVWTPQQSKPNPSFVHATQKGAEDEAQRLAKRHPGQEFYAVLIGTGYRMPPSKLETIE